MLPMKIENLCFNYKTSGVPKSWTLDHVNFCIEPGQVKALLGINGAGKSTILSCATGKLSPQSGKTCVFGSDPREASARLNFGYLAQDVDFPKTLSCYEILQFGRSHYSRPWPLEMCISKFHLEEIIHKKAHTLSGGQRRKLGLALAFGSGCRLIILDEPSSGLDGQSRISLLEEIAKFGASGGGMLLTSHYLDEVEKVASSLVFLQSGKVLFDGEMEKFLSDFARIRISMNSPEQPDKLMGLLKRPLVTNVEFENGPNQNHERRFSFVTSNSDEVVRQLFSSQLKFSDLRINEASLEDVVSQKFTEVK